MQALGASGVVEKAFLELASGGAAFGVGVATGFDPDLGKADDHPAEQAEDQGGLGIVNAAVILAQGHVQGMMEAAFNDPIAALEPEKASGIQLFEGQAADEIDDLGGFLALAPDSAPEPGNALHSRKAHQGGRGFPAVQHPDFVASPIVLAGHHMGARRGPRGKIAVG